MIIVCFTFLYLIMGLSNCQIMVRLGFDMPPYYGIFLSILGWPLCLPMAGVVACIENRERK